MRYAKHTLVVALLVLAGMTSFQLRVSNSRAAGKSNNPSADKSSWSVYCLPYISADIDRRPVIVRSVTTDPKRGLAVNKVEIFSRSKAVRSVKLKWYLSDDKNKGVILLQGETPSIKFDRVLPAGGTTEVRRDVVVFDEILDKVSDHAARGAEFRLDVSVGSAAYADGDTWEEQAAAGLDYLSVPAQARAGESLSDYLNSPKELDDGFPFAKIGYAKSAPAPAPQSCIPTYTACVYHPCGRGCYWADCSNPIPGASMCVSDPYGSWCTTTYCG
ncbi:MAG TPA: hypothetical protein VN256_13505 [Pyrinomonadaceae bacterium]|nr:hypothetical protein [Pyrinomonadaceae bacterium]